MEQDTPDTHLTPMPITDPKPKSYSSHSRLGYAHWALNGLKRSFFIMGISLVLGLSSQALARTIKIVEAQNLELRNVVVEDETGRKETQEFVIISGPRVELQIDKSKVIAQRIEFNKTRRTLTLVGKGIYTSVTTNKDGSENIQTLEGNDLVVGVADEGVQGQDVLISTTALEIIGQEIQRIPGQINVDGGYFTTCAKCGRNPNDYAFRARNLVIYPGDRLIAYDAQVLLADDPIFYFPILVMFLGEERFQPKISIGKSDLDGLTFSVGLPFVLGDQAFGFSTLNFYQNRDPAFGFETKFQAYDLFSDSLGATNTLNFSAKLDPKPLISAGKYFDDAGGYLYDYSLNWQGRWMTLTDQGLKFSIDIKRADSKTDITLQKITSSEFKVQTSFPDFNFDATYSDRYLHNDNSDSSNPSNLNTNVAEPQNVLKKPEVVFDLKPWKDIWEIPNLNADFKFTLGNYHAPTNLANRQALTEATIDPKSQVKFSDASRLKAEYTLGYNKDLWKGATFSVTNNYTGQFFSNGDRAVSVQLGSSFNQIWDRNNFKVQYDFTRIEGLSPFNFDAPPTRASSSQTVSASGTLSPLEGISLTANQSYDLLQKDPTKQNAAQFGASLNLGSFWKAVPIAFDYTVQRNFFQVGGEPWGVLTNWTASGKYNQAPLSLSAYTSWQATSSVVAPSNFSPLLLQATLGEPSGQNRLDLSLNRDLNKDEWYNGNFSFLGFQKPETPNAPVWQVGANETYTFNNPKIQGSENIAISSGNLNKTNLLLEHNFLLKDQVAEPEDSSEGKGLFKATLTNTQAISDRGSNTFSLGFGSSDYDLEKDAWGLPLLTASYSMNDYRQSLKASLEVSAPGLTDPEWRFRNINISGNQEIVQDRLALQIGANYNRVLNNQNILETLNLNPLRLIVALGEVEHPAAYLETSLLYNIQVTDGKYYTIQNPLQPTIALIIDRCCWALRGELNIAKGSIKFSWLIPSSKPNTGTSLLEVDQNKTRSILDVLSEGKP